MIMKSTLRNKLVLCLSAVLVTLYCGYVRSSEGPAPTPELTINIAELARQNSSGNILKLLNPVIDEKNRRLYFTGVKSNHVGVVDIDRDELVETFDIGIPGGFLLFDDDSGRLFLFQLEVDRYFEVDLEKKVAQPITGLPEGVALPERRKPVQYNGNTYVETGYPFRVGYLQDRNAAYGVIEVRNGSGTLVRKIYHGPDALYFAIDQMTGKLYATNTGDGSISIFDLNREAEKIKDLNVGVAVERVLVDSNNNGLFALNRLGGSSVYYYRFGDQHLSTISNENVSGDAGIGLWPTEIIHDQGSLYVLSHYGGRVDIIDGETLRLIDSINLQLDYKPRTDALSSMAMDTAKKRLYIAIPELGVLAMVDVAQKAQTKSVEIWEFNDTRTGPGRINLSVDEVLDKVFVYLPDDRSLQSYDATTLELQNSVNVDAGRQRHLLLANAAEGVLYLGNKKYDPTSLKEIGQYQRGARVIGFDQVSKRVYLVSPTSSGRHEITEKVYEYQGNTLRRQWTLSPVLSINSTFAFDFANGWFYAGYFERGTIERFALDDGMIPRDDNALKTDMGSTGTGARDPAAGGRKGKCGDGICQPVELQNGVCPEDCENEEDSPAAAGGTKQPGRCGDGICQPVELKHGVCPEDCENEQKTPAPPGTMQRGRCGDGICQPVELRNGVCPEDCTG